MDQMRSREQVLMKERQAISQSKATKPPTKTTAGTPEVQEHALPCGESREPIQT